jgi:hypothetical protein
VPEYVGPSFSSAGSGLYVGPSVKYQDSSYALAWAK